MLAVLAALALVIAAPPPAFTLTGSVTWADPRPPLLAFVAKDAHVCGASGPVYRRWVDHGKDGEVAGALVYLDGPGPKGAKAKTAVIDQQNCVYVPRALALPAGSSLRFTSSDAVLHNVRVLDAAGRTWANYALPVKGQKTPPLVLAQPGRYEIVCEAGHGWMNAHVLILEHDKAATTDARGGFRIEGLPPGRHAIVAWHPDLGRVIAEVEGKAGEHVRTKLVFQGAPGW